MVAPKVDRIAKEAAASRELETRRREQLLAHLSYYAAHPGEIDARLQELDEEWDADRVVAVNGNGLSLFGLLAGLLGRKRWYVVSLVTQSLMIQHSAKGCSAA